MKGAPRIGEDFEESALQGGCLSSTGMHPTSELIEDKYSTVLNPNWLSSVDAPLAVLSDPLGKPRFAEVSRGFLIALGLSEAEIRGRRLDEVLSREVQIPLQQALSRACGDGRTTAISLPWSARGRRRRRIDVEVRGAAPGWAVIEILPTDADPAGATRRVLFDHLNRIGAGTTYVYDRSPSVALNLSILLGFDDEVLRTRARSSRTMVHPEDLTSFIAHRRRLGSVPEGEVAAITVRMKHSDGQWRWIEVREQVLARDDRGKISQILGHAADVSRHRALAEAASRLTTAVLTAEQDERRRIARELHDSMAQHLVVIDLTMSRLQRDIPEALPVDAVADIRDALQAAHREVRTFSYLLHPPDLERLGLGKAIGKFVVGFGFRTGLVVELDLADLGRLDPVVELTLFRVVQEALMNVYRHARARSVIVTLLRTGDDVRLEVSDDGIGLGETDIGRLLERGNSGVGLQGIRARVNQLGGRFEISSPGRGFSLTVSLPGIAEGTIAR